MTQLTTAVPVVALATTAPRDGLDSAFARFLRLDVANGDASIDTVRGYRSQLAAWVTWCAGHVVDAKTATVDDVKLYREELVSQGRKPTTIAHKLNVLRRVYAAAVAAGLRADNPVIGIRAPRDRRAPEDFGFLSEVELALLFRAVPHDDKLKHLRDRALLGLLGLQALRTIEIMRANVGDLQRRGDDWALLVHGKIHDRLVFLRPDVAEALPRLPRCSRTPMASHSSRRPEISRVAIGSAGAVCATSSTATWSRRR